MNLVKMYNKELDELIRESNELQRELENNEITKREFNKRIEEITEKSASLFEYLTKNKMIQ